MKLLLKYCDKVRLNLVEIHTIWFKDDFLSCRLTNIALSIIPCETFIEYYIIFGLCVCFIFHESGI